MKFEKPISLTTQEPLEISDSTDPLINKIRNKLYENHPSIFQLIQNDSHHIMIDIQIDADGKLIRTNDDTCSDSPRMREIIRIATLIKKSLPAIADDHVRLWRGNRPNEVGLNPSYTNSLEGIALPFLLGYEGLLSYIDIPKQDGAKYVHTGVVAKDAEFILPKDLVKHAQIVGMSDKEANILKSQSKPEDSNLEFDLWNNFK
ncbi:MAG: hypothetical protein U0518_02505 [Candidatus Gracilibacteria bacterium]